MRHVRADSTHDRAPHAGAATLNRRAILAGLAGSVIAAGSARTVLGQGEATPDPAGATSAEQGWSFTDDRGVTATAPETPSRIVAYVNPAAALADFGIRPVGMYGQSRKDNGELADFLTERGLDQDVTLFSETWGEFDLEQLLALDADLLVDSMHPDGNSLWYLPDDLVPTVEARMPVVGIQFTGGPSSDEIIRRYEDLAAALGADLDAPDLAAAREEYAAAVEDLSAAIVANPDLTVLPVSATTDAPYIGGASYSPDLIFFRSLGLNVIQHANPDEMWEELSWEQINTYPADLIIRDRRPGAITEAEYAEIATWASLPAVQAGQVANWYPETVYSYQGFTGYLREMTAAIQAARPLGS